jgi:integrase/recombinase XerD
MLIRRPRKRQRAPFPGDPADRAGFHALALDFLEAFQAIGRTAETAYAYGLSLAAFARWCFDRDLARPRDITRPILERYQRWLFHARRKDGKPLSFSTQQARLQAVASFFRWLTRQNHVAYNPAADLEMPRAPRTIPREVLTASEVETILALPDLATAEGQRDRAIIEVLYSTGIRRFEACNLTVWDIDRERGTLLVRQGKGRKDRVVPVGERAVAWVDRYVNDARPRLQADTNDSTLFLTNWGERFNPDRLTHDVRGYVKAAGVAKQGACHLFRHSMATLMLENGADIRFIQQILGHESLATTQIYTQVAIAKLKEIHTATHPGARLEKRNGEQLKKEAAPRHDVDELRAQLEQLLLSEREDEDAAK